MIYSNKKEFKKLQNFTITKIVNCSYFYMGDGRCDEINNKAECEYDKGDCCQFECIENCKSKLKEGFRCQYECGFTFYSCKKSEKCQKCVHGKCLDINECFKNDEMVKKNIDNCNYNTMSMGNLKTIDSNCGKDPNMTVIHYMTDIVFLF